MSTNSLALPCSGGAGERAVVILQHAADDGMRAAMEVLQQLSRAAQLRPLMSVTYEAPSGDDPAPPSLGRSTRILDSGDWSSAGLMFTLHHLGELRRIDAVAVCTAALAPRRQAELAGAIEQLQADLSRFAPKQTQALSHRVWCPDYGEDGLAPAAEYAEGAPTGVLVVLPTDRQHEQAVAMPVSAADDRSIHAWHVASELASLAGLWSTMLGAPLELVHLATGGTGRPLVRLVQSTCRAARIRIPSPAQTLRDEGLLPLPPGELPAPDPGYLVTAAAPHVFPEEFRLRVVSVDDGVAAGEPLETWGSERSELMPHLQPVSQAVLATEAVGAVLDRHDDVAEAAKRLDDFELSVAQAVPWAATLIDPTGELRTAGDASDPAARPVPAPGPNPPASGEAEEDDCAGAEPSHRREIRALAAARERLMDDLPPVSLDGVPPSGWDSVLGSCLGIADASGAAADARSAALAERFVALNRHAIAPEPSSGADGLDEVIVQIAQLAHISESGRYRKIGASGDLLDVDGLPADGLSEDCGDSASGKPRGDASSAFRATPPGDASGPSQRPPLVVAVTREFDGEIGRCEMYVTRCLRALRDRLEPDQRPEPGVTSFVAYSLLASLLVGVAALLTLTGVREVLSPDRLPIEPRVMLFCLVSLLAALPPMLRLTPSRSLSAQVRLTLIAGVFAAAAATIVVLAGPISRSPLNRSGQWWPAIVTVLAVMILAVAAWIRGFSGDRTLLGPLAPLVSDRVAGVVPLLYAFVVAVSALNYDPIAPDVFEHRSWRLLTVLLAGAAAVAIAAGGLVRVIRSRDRRIVRDWRDGVIGLVDRCELAAARVQAMQILRRHWLVTAAVIARLVHRPFGSGAQPVEAADPPAAVRKLLMLNAELTDKTRDMFLTELIPELAPRGWMNRRFQMMSERFVDQERTRFAVDDPARLPPPEHCTYPLPQVPPAGDAAAGYRWGFAQQVYRGDFDDLLGRATDDALEAALSATIMSERAGVLIGASKSERVPLAALFSELLPSGEARLPSGLLPPRVEDAPAYTPYVWWPLDLPVPTAADRPQQECRVARFGGSVLFHAVRVDVSEPFDLERLVPVSETGLAPSDSPTEPGTAQRQLREPLM